MENIIENKEPYWSCYILESSNNIYSNRTYVGFTNNIKKRIKQHNGIIAGGAKATIVMRPNNYYCIITGFPNKRVALRCEWLLKHPNGTKRANQRYSGKIGRIRGLNYLLTQSEKWRIRSGNCSIKIWIKSNLVNHLEINSFSKNIEVFLC